MRVTDDVRREFSEIIEAARTVSMDLAGEVEHLLQEGVEHPLSKESAARLLTKTVSVLREFLIRSKDEAASATLNIRVEELVDRVLRTRESFDNNGSSVPAKAADATTTRIDLSARNGIPVRPVFPTPCFHEIEVPMRSGFFKTSDIQLWGENVRLDLHLRQFRQRNGRGPTPDELLDIMLSKMDLPGILDVPGVSRHEKEDQFAIAKLARSIANNGVRKPPILDIDGTLLDGNRRVAACWYVLNNDEFDSSQKQRAEYVFVWQLTEHATDDQRNAVVVSLNFEDDCKEEWPEYVRAQKIYEEWQALLQLEHRAPGSQRQAQLKRGLSKKFALGPDTSVVNRYLKMVEWATDFEDYHINKKLRDEFEVKHRANRYFQYFDELSRGATTGGVASALGRDEGFKHLVFDLLFEGKFKNWRQIRELKLIYDNEEAQEALGRARGESDPEIAEEHLENAITIARSKQAEMREIGANTRIESFVKWLEELPVRAFRDNIKRENLRRLLKALRLVEKQATAVLDNSVEA